MQLYADTNDTRFIDRCCHNNRAGSEQLTIFMVKSIREENEVPSLRDRGKQPSGLRVSGSRMECILGGVSRRAGGYSAVLLVRSGMEPRASYPQRVTVGRHP